MNAVLQEAPLLTGHATIVGATHAQLAPSVLNVRRKPVPQPALKAQLRAFGLLQNLVGVWSQRKGVLIDVIAGCSRLLYIGELIAEGEWPADFIIPVLIVDAREAVAISLAENMGREPMHPADVIDAMLALAEAGASAQELGLSFGLGVDAVRRHLKLARVAPPLLALYRAGEATLEQMMALAASDDTAAQQQAWDSLSEWQRQPEQLRRALTRDSLRVERDRVVRFVGVRAIEQAGGVVREDVFSSDGARYIDDAALVERLGQHRLQRAADKLRSEGHAWVEVVLRSDASLLSAYGRAPLVARTPNAAEAEELAQIEAALAAQGAAPEDTGALHAWQAQRRILHARETTLRTALRVPDEAARSISGALVTLDEEGKVKVHRHLIRPADRAPEATARARRVRGAHSEKLLHLLSAHRTAALAACVAARPPVALALLADALLRALSPSGSRPLAQIRLQLTCYPEAVAASKAGQALAAAHSAVEATVNCMPQGVERIAALAALPLSELEALIGTLVAFSLDTLQGVEDPHMGAAALARLADCNPGEWWQATAADYFDHVAKAQMLAAVKEARGAAAAVPLEKLPRAQAAHEAARLLQGSGWLPPMLRLAVMEKPDVEVAADVEHD